MIKYEKIIFFSKEIKLIQLLSSLVMIFLSILYEKIHNT